MSVPSVTLDDMPNQALLLSPAGLLLAGAMCLAWSVATTGPTQRRWRRAAEALWAAGGLLGLAVIAMTVLHLCTQPWARTTLGEGAAGIFTGGVSILTAVGLLGYIGVWARLRGSRRPGTVVLHPDETGEWARASHDLSSANVIDLPSPAYSIDPLAVVQPKRDHK